MFDEISELSVRFYTASPYILLRRLRRPIPSLASSRSCNRNQASKSFSNMSLQLGRQARRQARVLAGPSSVILKGALIVEYVG